jgi:hypothetical protein
MGSECRPFIKDIVDHGKFFSGGNPAAITGLRNLIGGLPA